MVSYGAAGITNRADEKYNITKLVSIIVLS